MAIPDEYEGLYTKVMRFQSQHGKIPEWAEVFVVEDGRVTFLRLSDIPGKPPRDRSA